MKKKGKDEHENRLGNLCVSYSTSIVLYRTESLMHVFYAHAT